MVGLFGKGGLGEKKITIIMNHRVCCNWRWRFETLIYCGANKNRTILKYPVFGDKKNWAIRIRVAFFFPRGSRLRGSARVERQ